MSTSVPKSPGPFLPLYWAARIASEFSNGVMALFSTCSQRLFQKKPQVRRLIDDNCNDLRNSSFSEEPPSQPTLVWRRLSWGSSIWVRMVQCSTAWNTWRETWTGWWRNLRDSGTKNISSSTFRDRCDMQGI